MEELAIVLQRGQQVELTRSSTSGTLGMLQRRRSVAAL